MPILMSLPVVRIILYVKDIPKVAAFYEEHFGLLPLPSLETGWLELRAEPQGCIIALHQAARTQKSGSAVKIVFGTDDVQKFVADRAKHGLAFGPVHSTQDFAYANTKDPAGNSISVSSRGMKKRSRSKQEPINLPQRNETLS